MGHSRLQVRQHHVKMTESPWIVVSGTVAPTAPQKGHFGGTRNLTRLWGKGAESVSHRLCSHLLPFGVVPMVDVERSARNEERLRHRQRGIACHLRRSGDLAVQIAGFDHGCRYPDSRRGVVNDNVADFRARTPRCAHRDPQRLARCRRSVQKHALRKSAISVGSAPMDDAESRRTRPLVSATQQESHDCDLAMPLDLLRRAASTTSAKADRCGRAYNSPVDVLPIASR